MKEICTSPHTIAMCWGIIEYVPNIYNFPIRYFFKHIDPEQKITFVQFKIHKALIFYILISIENRMLANLLRVAIYMRNFAHININLLHKSITFSTLLRDISLQKFIFVKSWDQNILTFPVNEYLIYC